MTTEASSENPPPDRITGQYLGTEDGKPCVVLNSKQNVLMEGNEGTLAYQAFCQRCNTNQIATKEGPIRQALDDDTEFGAWTTAGRYYYMLNNPNTKKAGIRMASLYRVDREEVVKITKKKIRDTRNKRRNRGNKNQQRNREHTIPAITNNDHDDESGHEQGESEHHDLQPPPQIELDLDGDDVTEEEGISEFLRFALSPPTVPQVAEHAVHQGQEKTESIAVFLDDRENTETTTATGLTEEYFSDFDDPVLYALESEHDNNNNDSETIPNNQDTNTPTPGTIDSWNTAKGFNNTGDNTVDVKNSSEMFGSRTDDNSSMGTWTTVEKDDFSENGRHAFGSVTFSSPKRTKVKPDSIVPPKNDIFGRGEELNTLAEKLKNDDERLIAIVGVAGVGKSRIAQEGSRLWYTSRDDRLLYFIAGGNRFDGSLLTDAAIRDGYQEIWRCLGKPMEELDSASATSLRDMSKKIMVELQHTHRDYEWLIVFDDVPEVVGEEEKGAAWLERWFFPGFANNVPSNGHILVTTRSKGLHVERRIGRFGKPIEIDPLEEDGAKQMFLDVARTSVLSECDAFALTNIVREFECLPLAIWFAAINLGREKSAYTIEEYWIWLQNNDNVVGDQFCQVLEQTVAYACRNGASEALQTLSCLYPARIPKMFVAAFLDGVSLLLDLNLLQRVDNHTYSMHRLVQKAVREKRMLGNPIGIIAMLGETLTETFNFNASSTWHKTVHLIPHTEALERNVDGLWDGLPCATKKELSKILKTCGDFYMCLPCEFKVAEEKYQKRLRLIQEYENKEQGWGEHRWETEFNLGFLYLRIRNENAAKQYIKQSVSSAKKEFGDDHVKVAHSLKNWGMWLTAFGELEEALAVLQNVRKRLIAANYESLRFVNNNIGNVHMRRGEYRKAISCYKMALDETDAETDGHGRAIDLRNVGRCYQLLEDKPTAAEYLTSALRLYEGIYGEKETEDITEIKDLLDDMKLRD